MSIFTFSAEEKVAYRAFCQSHCNVPIIAGCYIVSFVFFACRNLDRFWENWAMVVAFIMGVVAMVTGSACVTSRASVWAPVAQRDLDAYPLLKWSRQFFQDLHGNEFYWTLINDALMFAYPAVCSFSVLGKAMMPPCLATVSAWNSQFCNIGGAIGTDLHHMDLPSAIFMLQVFLSGARSETIMTTWLVQIAVINAALVYLGSPTIPWVNLQFIIGMAIRYACLDEGLHRPSWLTSRHPTPVTLGWDPR